MKCQILFSGKNKKNIISLSSAENAQRVVKVKKAEIRTNILELFLILFKNKGRTCQERFYQNKYS